MNIFCTTAPMSHRLTSIFCTTVPTSRRLTSIYHTNVSPLQRGGAVPSPLSERWIEMASNYPEGPRPSSRPLTGHSWTATLFFPYDRTLIYSPPFIRLFILLLLLAIGNVHPNPAPPLFTQ